MAPDRLDFIPYPSIARHGVIGDRRTVALVDARSGDGLGNFPLLFSQAEYIRAVIALERARSFARRATSASVKSSSLDRV